jgi:cell division septum initiation protein DivIVA/phage host-nuclease inhibitor protein Gam
MSIMAFQAMDGEKKAALKHSNTKIDGLKESDQELKVAKAEQVKALKDNIQDLKNDLADKKSSANDMRDTIQDLRQRNHDMKTVINDNIAAIKDLKKTYEAQQSDNRSLYTQLQEAYGAVTKNVALQNQIIDLQHETGRLVTGWEDKYAELQGQYNDLDANWRANESLIDEMYKARDDFQQQIAELKQKIKELEQSDATLARKSPRPSMSSTVSMTEVLNNGPNNGSRSNFPTPQAPQGGQIATPGSSSRPLPTMQVRTGHGTLKEYSTLPENVRTKLETEVKSWKHDWESQAMKVDGTYSRMKNQRKTAVRHTTHKAQAACEGCVKAKLPCLTWDATEKSLLVLPLASEDRMFSDESRNEYWLWLQGQESRLSKMNDSYKA